MERRYPPAPFVPFDRDAEVQKRARHLPHWEQSGCTYFVTFRLADAVSQVRLGLWQSERDTWLRLNPEPWSVQQRRFYNERFVERLQQFLDAGYGACELRHLECSGIVESTLRWFDGSRYDLADYSIMPNHVHALVRPQPNRPISKILQAWKGFSAKEINRRLGRVGTLWLDESFDHLVRSGEQFQYLRRYILENPRKAGLTEGGYRVGFGLWRPM